MDDDSRILRLREYVRLYLRRLIKENKDAERRVQFLSKKSLAKSRKSKVTSFKEKQFNENKKNQRSNVRNKKVSKRIEEEIGRSHSSVSSDAISHDKVFNDLKIEIYPVGQTFMASIEDKKGKKISKLFRDEQTAQVWVRNNSLKMSKIFTQ